MMNKKLDIELRIIQVGLILIAIALIINTIIAWSNISECQELCEEKGLEYKEMRVLSRTECYCLDENDMLYLVDIKKGDKK